VRPDVVSGPHMKLLLSLHKATSEPGLSHSATEMSRRLFAFAKRGSLRRANKLRVARVTDMLPTLWPR